MASFYRRVQIPLNTFRLTFLSLNNPKVFSIYIKLYSMNYFKILCVWATYVTRYNFPNPERRQYFILLCFLSLSKFQLYHQQILFTYNNWVYHEDYYFLSLSGGEFAFFMWQSCSCEGVTRRNYFRTREILFLFIYEFYFMLLLSYL